MPRPLTQAYDFLTRTFANHQLEQLDGKLEGAGRVISKTEGAKLGLDADTFADFYTNVRTPGGRVGRNQLLQFAGEKFQTQMEALRESLSQGPGADGFALAKDVLDNWQSFIAKPELFKFAELPASSKETIIRGASWRQDEIPARPADEAITRSRHDGAGDFPRAIQTAIETVESKHYVHDDPAEHPYTAGDVVSQSFNWGETIKVDDVTVGYRANFGGRNLIFDAQGQALNSLGLYEVDPAQATGFGNLPKASKVEAMQDETIDTGSWQQWSDKSVDQVLTAMGSSMDPAAKAEAIGGGKDYVADTLDNDLYYTGGISLRGLGVTLDADYLSQFDSYEALVNHLAEKATAQDGPEAGEELLDALGNGGAAVGGPEVTVFEEDGELVGAKFNWGVCVDGDHDYWYEIYYDKASDAFIGGATGGYETDTETWID